ncbi:LytR/AlgR family response regulator transcription factor [Flavobacterium restrictum]|uniref:Response regulator transcription factor n=1 Tax=Flavobacterium restrictum TaxID=2594428 RepID=A0A553ED33_9FLAO|nr:LytTR family DNA-binding domain-containing protein [Flavobacterium restrictum]TRX42895.1 response regulator transcription factor [Flavobacterium restrictum]
MKVVIIEDEKLSAEHLTVLLQKIDPSITVIKYFDTIKTSVTAFKEGLTADLIFMDIHLADGNSFEIFNQIALEIPVVFTTAFDNYAIQAFKQNSIDYLLKPIALQDLQFAVEKFKKQQQSGNKDLISSIATAYQQLNKEYKTRFLVKSGQTIDTIKIEEIHHFETKESLSFLVTNKGNHHLIDYTLDQLETMLQPKNFFRINRKIILNIQSIEKVSTYFNSRLSIATKFLNTDSRIVSRERVNDFKKWLDN